jgi:hypothetical protein
MKNRIFVFAAAFILTVSSSPAQQEAVAPAAPPAGKSYEAAAKLVLPKVDFRESTIREALEFLQQRSRALDPKGAKGGGINIILKDEANAGPVAIPRKPPGPPPIPGLEPGPAPAAPAAPAVGGATTKITLALNNVPLTEVLKYIANLSNCRIRWDENAVVFIAPAPGKMDVPEAKPRTELKVTAGAEAMVAKLKGPDYVMPKVDFRETSAREAFDFLSQRAKALGKEPAGISFVLKFEDGRELPTITYAASHLPFLDVIRYTAELGGLEVTVDPFAIVLTPQKAK